MLARKIQGRTIVAVHQSRVHRDDTGGFAGYSLDYLELDNGARIYFRTIEAGYGYETEGVYAKPGEVPAFSQRF